MQSPGYRPNVVQVAMQRLAALSWASWLLARVLHLVDLPLMRLTRARLSLTRLLTGLPVVLLTTVGARSGRERATPLVGLREGDNIILIASSFGRARNPAWYYNLRARPEATVIGGGETGRYTAREVNGAGRERYWQMAVAMYRGFAAYAVRASRRVIPVIVLTPVSG